MARRLLRCAAKQFHKVKLDMANRKALLSHNAKVYILTRNREKTEATIAELKELTKNEAYFVKCDLSDLKSVKVAAEEFTR